MCIRDRVKRIFGQYVSKKVVDKILKHSDAMHLEGERKPLTIFFMDFAGFTAMSEKLDPSELVKLISEYHNEAAEEIFKTEGTLDKFCLLYTSPSPRDRQKSRMPSSA